MSLFLLHKMKKPTKCRNGVLSLRSANQEQVFSPLYQSGVSNFALVERAKLTKNALFIDQSAFSNFALYVIIRIMLKAKRLSEQWTVSQEAELWMRLLDFFLFPGHCILNQRFYFSDWSLYSRWSIQCPKWGVSNGVLLLSQKTGYTGRARQDFNLNQRG